MPVVRGVPPPLARIITGVAISPPPPTATRTQAGPLGGALASRGAVRDLHRSKNRPGGFNRKECSWSGFERTTGRLAMQDAR